MNALFLEILNFDAIDFTSSRLQPFREVEKRLQNIIVYEDSSEKSKLDKNDKLYQ